MRGLTLIDSDRLAGFVLLSRQGHDVTLGRAAVSIVRRTNGEVAGEPRKKCDLSPGSLPNGRHGCRVIPARSATWRVTRAESGHRTSISLTNERDFAACPVMH